MAEDRLWKRILTGRKDEKKGDEKEVPQESAKDTGLPEKILNAPISRRSVLGGVATTAGHIASSGTIPQTPVVITKEIIKERTPQLLKHLSPRIGFLLRFCEEVGRAAELGKRYISDTHEIDHPTIQDIFQKGLPLNSDGVIDPDGLLGALFVIRDSETGLGMIPDNTAIVELMNGKLLNEALEISSERWHWPNVNAGETVRGAVTTLREITGLDENSTVKDLRDVLKGKPLEFLKNVVNNAHLLPPKGSKDRYEIFKQLHRIVYSGVKSDFEPATAEYVEHEYEKEFQLDEERNKAFRERADKERRDIFEEYERTESERLNNEMSERQPIRCFIESAMKEQRDAKDAKVFSIRPSPDEVGQRPVELNRMHIQHLRQSLTKGGVLDNFDPSNTQVEILGSFLRVSTSDKKFQDYLASFTNGKLLEIPNRQQTTLSPDPDIN